MGTARTFSLHNDRMIRLPELEARSSRKIQWNTNRKREYFNEKIFMDLAAEWRGRLLHAVDAQDIRKARSAQRHWSGPPDQWNDFGEGGLQPMCSAKILQDSWGSQSEPIASFRWSRLSWRQTDSHGAYYVTNLAIWLYPSITSTTVIKYDRVT